MSVIDNLILFNSGGGIGDYSRIKSECKTVKFGVYLPKQVITYSNEVEYVSEYDGFICLDSFGSIYSSNTKVASYRQMISFNDEVLLDTTVNNISSQTMPKQMFGPLPLKKGDKIKMVFNVTFQPNATGGTATMNAYRIFY